MKRRTFVKTGTLAGLGLATADTRLLAADTPGPSVGALFDQSMIWCRESVRVPLTEGPGNADLHAVFIKEIEVSNDLASASVHLFCFIRYRLYINGEYAGRGPSRFQNQRPEYDTRIVTASLRAGVNIIAVLVHCDSPTGRIMSHAPGFTAVVEVAYKNGHIERTATGPNWRSMPERSFGPRNTAWGSIPESIDARAMPDWTDPTFDAAAWPDSVRVDRDASYPIWPRSTPLQPEKLLLAGIAPGHGPMVLSAGQQVEFPLAMIAQVYHRLSLDADAGSSLQIDSILPSGNTSVTYIARQGQQVYIGGDTFPARSLRLTVLSGRVSLSAFDVFEVRYPFERLGSFSCSDPLLDRIWALCARSLELLSEDAYVDCADRERVEWMDCSPPAFEMTRVCMAGPAPDGGRVYSDPRLLRALLRRTALTAQTRDPWKGMMKAHTCSERFDIHGFMEDRACDWVIGLRQYYESTGDKAFVREMWPALTGLMQWFLDHQTERGLVLAREWETANNPLTYQVCEGAGLNAFVYRALVDSAYLGSEIGHSAEAVKYARDAAGLVQVFNSVFWLERDGAYSGGLFPKGSKIVTNGYDKQVAAHLDPAGLYLPTLHAALFALDFGMVPPDRVDRVREWVLKNKDTSSLIFDGATSMMLLFYLFRVLYAIDQPGLDCDVLDKVRAGWKQMLDSPWQTTWEHFNYGSFVHIYGVAAGPFLSSHVLGVRLDGPASARRLLVEPHPGGLNHAEGVVVTEFDLVPISWEMNGQVDGQQSMTLNITVPDGVQAVVRLPAVEGKGELSVDRVVRAAKREGNRLTTYLPSGKYVVEVG